ncbi:MAG: MaoC/PaaZ C-terminal domain-containing protein [Candidatus Geothermincolia bacterium]
MALRELQFSEVRVGQEIPPFHHTFDKMDAIIYAGASGDFNPIHVDPEVAKMAGHPNVIAHGLFNMALLGKTITDWIGDPGNLKKFSCQFRGRVLPGDTVTFKGVVRSLDEAERLAVLDIWAENQEGVRVLDKAEATIELA